MKNPFTPNFGQVPYLLAGRNDLIYELLNAYDNAPGDPSLSSILQGARGTGKTAFLTYMSREVQQKDWICVNVPCANGMLEDIYEQSLSSAEHLLTSQKRAVKGRSLEIAGFGGGIDLSDAVSVTRPNWRSRMTRVLEFLDEYLE